MQFPLGKPTHALPEAQLVTLERWSAYAPFDIPIPYEPNPVD
ncbi:hypothetical protein [Siphonobacter sp.]